MSRILLIDADSTIPNIALMKLSTYHKMLGDSVDFIRVGLPYYPTRIKTEFVCPSGYDKTYCSVIFDGNKEFIVGDSIIFGGTGVNLVTVLDDVVEQCDCDYSLYPDNDVSYGFITRGCIRNCSFCKVPRKEGNIHQVAQISDIVRHKKVKFLDNNILSFSGHKQVISELVERKIKCQFNQGLDIRLVDKENSDLLSDMNYMGEYIFAFDSWKYNRIIDERLNILDWRNDWQFKFFVYVHPTMMLSDTIRRIAWLRSRKCLPYIMRDIACWRSEYCGFYVDLAAYCNQVHIFKKMDFDSFLVGRHTKQDRIKCNSRIWHENQ